MIRSLEVRQKVFRSLIYVVIYGMIGLPIFSSTGFTAAEPAKEKVELSKKEKKKLVEQGVAEYKAGDLDGAKKTLEQAKAAFPENYAAPYYLGLIYLKKGQRSAAIAEWQQYILMDPKSENALKIRKHLTLLLRKEAEESAKQAVAKEAALLTGPVDDNTVAVSTFENLGSKTLGPLGKGMAAMLIHDLSQVPDLQVVERVKLQAVLKEMNQGTSGLVDKKTAPKVGRLLKAKHVTTGNLTDLEKENLIIASAVVDTEKRAAIGSQEAQGELNKFYDLEKEIACKIVDDLGRDCKKMPGEFGKVHTKSLAALTAFSVGLDYLDQEKYDEAREEFQKALDEDPKFTLAEAALLATPVAAMAIMTTSQTVSSLSASGVSSAGAGSATVAGVGIGTTTAVVAGAAVVAGGAALIGGGGGGGDGSGGTVTNLTGDWSGGWASSDGSSGNLLWSLTQSDTSINGTVSVTGYPACISTGTVSGTITGSGLSGYIASVANTVSFDATFSATSMNGTWEVTGGSCAGDTGTFWSNLTGSGTISW